MRVYLPLNQRGKLLSILRNYSQVLKTVLNEIKWKGLLVDPGFPTGP
jgi:hypothetical protein